jgi:tetratricopeptide (TPR) repeat protein
MTRVAANDALIELWHPHAFHSDAFVFGHINRLSETLYDHLGCTFRSSWKDYLGAQWILQEIWYRVEPFVLEDIKNEGIEIDFAVCYLRDIIKEIGVFIRVDRTGSTGPGNYGRFVCHDRVHTSMRLSDGPRGEALGREGQGPLSGRAVELALAVGSANTENKMLRAECSNLQSIVAQTISERDALAAASTRWFDAVIAVTADHNPLARMPRKQNRWWRTLARHLPGGHGRPSPVALGNRARDAGRWELAVRYYRDALDLKPDEPEIWVQFGHALKEAGKVSEAELAYRKAIELGAKNADTNATLAHPLVRATR